MKKGTKSIISVFICFIISFAVTACAGNDGNNDTDGGGVKVYFCTNSQNVLREENYKGDSEFVLNTFRGDVESGQIIINPDKDVARFNFKVNDLVREGGSEKLTGEMFDVFAERYIEVVQSTSGLTETGWYPDALIPIKNYAAKRDNKIDKGNNQGIWINLNVPKDVTPGTYKGNGTLTLDDETTEFPMTVKIYNIDMPEVNHVKTAFFIDKGTISTGEGKVLTEELEQAYYQFAISKRISPMTFPDFSMPGARYEVDKYINAATEYLLNDKIACIQLPYADDGSGVVDQSYCEQILTALAEKNVELIEQGKNINFFEKVYYYLGTLIDEPTPEKYDKVRECDLRIHKAKLKVADSQLLKAYPELQQSVLKLNNIVTTKINPSLYGTDEVGGIQTWCPTIDNFAGEKARALAIERMNSNDRRGGEGVWWYTCINPKNPFPTLHLDDTLMSPRTTAWMQYDYKIQGRIYWSMNAWYRSVNRVKIAGYDVWRDAMNYEACNGDGILLYPGSKYGVNGPIATLRLEALRESNEDYELLWLAEQGIKVINERKGKNYDTDKVLDKFYGRLYTGVLRNADLNSTLFENVRKELLEFVEKVYHDETSAITLLDKYNK